MGAHPVDFTGSQHTAKDASECGDIPAYHEDAVNLVVAVKKYTETDEKTGGNPPIPSRIHK